MKHSPSPFSSSLPLTAQTRLLELFKQRDGILTTSEVNRAELPRVALTRLLERGAVLRVQRGVYRLTSSSRNAAVDAELDELLELQLRFAYARPCLVSALHLHGLTTTRPAALQLAIPAHRQLRAEAPAVEVYYFSTRHYSEGITELAVGQRTLLTYTIEKTLCDLLRYAPKLGRELYLEGLRKYLRRSAPNALIAQAKRLGIWKGMSRDVEVMLHDQDR